MAERLFPTQHRTLGALYDAGLHLHAFCLNKDCEWNAHLDVKDLIEKLGRRHGSMPADLVPILVCSQCGGKDIALTLAATDKIPETTAAYVRERERLLRNEQKDWLTKDE